MIIEHRLHQRLAVVERAVDGERMDVGVVRRRHHAALHVGDAAFGEQDDDVDVVAPRKASTAAPPVSPEVAHTMVARALGRRG